jgi:hypothetical protein
VIFYFRDLLSWLCSRFFKIFFLQKHYFDFRFRWPLPNIRFWPNIQPNIRPIASAEATFGRTLIMLQFHPCHRYLVRMSKNFMTHFKQNTDWSDKLAKLTDKIFVSHICSHILAFFGSNSHILIYAHKIHIFFYFW